MYKRPYNICVTAIYVDPPSLQDNFLLRIQENGRNVPVDLREDPPPFPEPSSFSWRKDGQSLIGPALTYSSVTFTTIEREDSGNYTVVARNFVVDAPSQQVGSDTGSFYLDVICEAMSCINVIVVYFYYVSRWTISFCPWSHSMLRSVE